MAVVHIGILDQRRKIKRLLQKKRMITAQRENNTDILQYGIAHIHVFQLSEKLILRTLFYHGDTHVVLPQKNKITNFGDGFLVDRKIQDLCVLVVGYKFGEGFHEDLHGTRSQMQRTQSAAAGKSLGQTIVLQHTTADLIELLPFWGQDAAHRASVKNLKPQFCFHCLHTVAQARL